MKNIIIVLSLAVFMFAACEPFIEDAPDVGMSPSSEDLSFTIAQGSDDFTFVFENTSDVTGIAHWDFGNGVKGTGNKVSSVYNLPGEYEVTLSIYTSGGNASLEKTHVTTETNYAIFTDTKYINISGGVDAVDGKAWVVDSVTAGHFGIGPANGTWPEWWGAASLQKTNSGAYDDDYVFKIEGFSFISNNNGNSYVKDFRKDDSNYSNPVALYGEPDCRVDYTPAAATWSIVTKEDGDYIVFSSETPTFFGFDYGGTYEYRIEELTENLLHVSTIGGDGNRWYNRLIPKGYSKPVVEFSAEVAAVAAENTWSVSLTDVVIPEGVTVTGFSVDFGDGSGSVDSDDYMGSVEHTYMRKGTYPVTVTVMATSGNVVANESVTVENHHSSYVPFLLDMMVMYVDNSEIELSPVLVENCSVTQVDNPSSIYPNKGSKVFHYSKTDQAWANAYMKLPAGYRFDLRSQSTFKLMAYGKAGDEVLLKLENTDKGGDAWQTGCELRYILQNNYEWEEIIFEFAGADVMPGAEGWKWWPEPVSYDVTTEDTYNHDFYNIVRIMLNANEDGGNVGTYEFYFDDLAGPHVEGLKSGSIN